MGKFLVHIAQDNGHNIMDKILSDYPNGQHYKISDDWWALKSDKLSADLAKEFGFLLHSNEDDSKPLQSVGFVARLDTMTGFYDRGLWEWDNND